MKRIALFLATNLAVLVVLSVIIMVTGIGQYMEADGTINHLELLILAAVIGFTGSFISLAMSKWSAKRMTGAQVITQPRNPTEQWLFDTVARQAKMAGIGMPEVAIYNAPEPNAFATGMNRNNALVAVSTGLMQAMTQDEVEAVLAHEVAHVANGDMVTMALIQGVVNTFVIYLSRLIGHFVDRVVFKSQNGHGPGFFIVTIVAQIVLGILASTITMWFSRQREFRADAGGAQLASREKMIAALEKLRRAAGENELPDQLAAFGISGHIGHGFKRLFMSHPPLEERIAALKSRV